MASNDPRRNARMSKNDPRLNRPADETKKRLASQSPAGGTQPQQKNPRPATNRESSIDAASRRSSMASHDSRCHPSVDNATPNASRPSSAQSNGINPNWTNNGSAFGTGNILPKPQTAPVAKMGNGQSPNQDSILSKLPSQPDYWKLVQASTEINGKLSFARNERDKARPALDKAHWQYDNAKPYFEDYPPIKEKHTKDVERAQRAYNKANDLAVLMEQESDQIKGMMADSSGSSTTVLQQQTDSLQQMVKSLEQKSREQDEVISKLRAELEASKAQQHGLLVEENQRQSVKLVALEQKSQQHDEVVSKLRADLEASKTQQDGLLVAENERHTAKLTALEKTVEKLELEKKEPPSNPLGMVQFTPVVGPEVELDEEALTQVQSMWSHIGALQVAVDNHKKQLDNLTTDDVVHQMVNVMGQHWPASEVNKLRADLDALVEKLKERERLTEENFKAMGEQVKSLISQVGQLQGVHEEALNKSLGL